MDLTEKHLLILEEIYNNTFSGGFIEIDKLQLNTGFSVSDLRPYLEDLKEEIYIFECPEGLQVSSIGIHFSRSRWV